MLRKHLPTRQAGWPAHYEKHLFERIDSTNDEAKRMLVRLCRSSLQNEAGGHWILAHEQLSGRGRRGRAWSSSAGNFSATLLLMLDDEPPTSATLRSFTMAVAVLEALEGALGKACAPRLSCKWPNDIMCEKRKLGGILLEYVKHDNRTALLIGIGLNLVPFGARQQLEGGAPEPISLAELGEAHALRPEDFLVHLAAHFDRFEQIYKTYGFGLIRAAWLERAQGLGQKITARLANGEVLKGRFEGIDEAGFLQLYDGDKMTLVGAGDVFLH